MLEFAGRIFGAAGDVFSRDAYLGLAVGAAFVAVFLSAMRRGPEPAGQGLGWTIWQALARLLWGAFLVGLLAGTLYAVQTALDQVERSFRHRYGRVTEVNLAAVRTIWGEDQAQRELGVSLGYDVEETQRLESEDPTRPAVLRKVTVRKEIASNPFVSARHTVRLEQSLRTKGSAVYPGYTTDCRFVYKLRNPDDHDAVATLRFPLPSRSSPMDALVVKLDGQDALGRVRFADNAIVLDHPLKAGAGFDFEVGFASRGMDSWYFQVREQREIRDFELLLTLPDLPQSRWNNPEGCMTPTTLEATPDGQGAVARYRLDHAIVGKGMGIALPRPTQPGEVEARVLRQMQKGWGWAFALVLLGLTLAGVRRGALWAVVLSAAIACAIGLLASLYETPLGFWVAAAVVLLPTFALLAWLLRSAAASGTGTLLGVLAFAFAGVAPFLAGIDQDRQLLYWNLCAAVFLVVAAVLALDLRRKAAD